MTDVSKLINDYKEKRKNAVLTVEQKEGLKQRIFAKLNSPVIEEEAVKLPKTHRSIWFNLQYAAIPLVIVIFFVSTAFASANSLPGDKLYPVKLFIEDSQIKLAPTEQAKTQLQTKFAEVRLQEVTKLQKQNNAIKKDIPKPKTQDTKEDENNDKQDRANQQIDQVVKNLEQTREQFEKRGDKNSSKKINEALIGINEQLKLINKNHKSKKDFKKDLENKLDNKSNREETKDEKSLEKQNLDHNQNTNKLPNLFNRD